MEILRKNKLTIYIAILIIVLGIVAFDLFGPKARSPEFGPIRSPSIISQTGLTAKSIEISFATERDLPKESTVFKIKENPISDKEVDVLANSFGFTKKHRQGKKPTWQQGGKKLIISKKPFSITFNNFNASTKGGKLSANQLISIAKDFLSSKKLLKTDLLVDENNLIFLTGDARSHLVVTEALEKANLVKIPFNVKKGTLYFYWQSPFDTGASVTLSRSGQVIKMVYQYPEIGKEATYPIKNLGGAKDRIKISGRLVYPDSSDTKLPIVRSNLLISDLLIEDYFLAYFVDYSSGFIQPIYVFRGRGFIGNYVNDVVIFVPALEDRWLK